MRIVFVMYTLVSQVLFGILSLVSMAWDWIKEMGRMCFM